MPSQRHFFHRFGEDDGGERERVGEVVEYDGTNGDKLGRGRGRLMPRHVGTPSQNHILYTPLRLLIFRRVYPPFPGIAVMSANAMS